MKQKSILIPTATLNKIIMTFTYPGGDRETNVLDGSKIEVIFFNTRDIRQSLESYYKTHSYCCNKEKIAQLCGDESVETVTEAEQKQLVAVLAEQLWEMENKRGILPPCIILNREGLPEFPQISLCVAKNVRPEITGMNVGLIYSDGREKWIPLHAADLVNIEWMDREMFEKLH